MLMASVGRDRCGGGTRGGAGFRRAQREMEKAENKPPPSQNPAAKRKREERARGAASSVTDGLQDRQIKDQRRRLQGINEGESESNESSQPSPPGLPKRLPARKWLTTRTREQQQRSATTAKRRREQGKSRPTLFAHRFLPPFRML